MRRKSTAGSAPPVKWRGRTDPAVLPGVAAGLRIPAGRKLVETNLLEWTGGPSLKAKNGAVEVKLKPFEIRTFKVK